METTLNLNLLSQGLITNGKVTEKCLLVIEVLNVIVLKVKKVFAGSIIVVRY